VAALGEAATEGTADVDALKRRVRQAVGRLVSERTRRRPMIVPVVVEA
jgi:ribonuclease J